MTGRTIALYEARNGYSAGAELFAALGTRNGFIAALSANAVAYSILF
jgi:hypothetical protein